MNNENKQFNEENTSGIDSETLSVMNDLWEEAVDGLNWDEHCDKMERINTLILSLVDAA